MTKKDFDIQTFCSGGPGGQHQNKVHSGVRIVHRASGAVGESRTERSQHQNKRLALKRLVGSKKFKLWVTKVASELWGGKTVDQMVEEAMGSHNIKVEVKGDSGRWEVEDAEGD